MAGISTDRDPEIEAETSLVLTLTRLSGVTTISESGSCVLSVRLFEMLARIDCGVSGKLMVMLEGGRIGEMFREGSVGLMLLLVELFEREADCVLEDFLDSDLLIRRILDLLVKYLSRLVCSERLLMVLGSRTTTF